VHNAGRSQIAAALFAVAVPPEVARAISAGTMPAERVHPEVLETLREIGIDLSLAKPQLLTRELVEGASMLITMGCGDECPVVPGVTREDWPLRDPKGRSVDDVRAIRDEIAARVQTLIATLREGDLTIELFHATNDPDSAVVRRRVSELGLEDHIRFRNVFYEEVTRDLRARGGHATPALWDGSRLHIGKSAALAVIETLPRSA
jgi:arsenate reductase